MNSSYPIHRAINRPLVFKGLCAQYVLYAFALFGVDFIVFIILFLSGLNSYLCMALALCAAAGGVISLYRTSIRYGEHGLMKRTALRRVPQAITFTSRSPFINLKTIK